MGDSLTNIGRGNGTRRKYKNRAVFWGLQTLENYENIKAWPKKPKLREVSSFTSTYHLALHFQQSVTLPNPHSLVMQNDPIETKFQDLGYAILLQSDRGSR
jgi:hypothetical protein